MTRRTHQAPHIRDVRHLQLEDLVGSAIVTAEGARLGRVVDLLAAPTPPYRVRSLIYGNGAWLYRLHVPPPFAEKLGLRFQPKEIPWDAVDDFNNYVVTLKHGDWSGRDFELSPAGSAVDSGS